MNQLRLRLRWRQKNVLEGKCDMIESRLIFFFFSILCLVFFFFFSRKANICCVFLCRRFRWCIGKLNIESFSSFWFVLFMVSSYGNWKRQKERMSKRKKKVRRSSPWNFRFSRYGISSCKIPLQLHITSLVLLDQLKISQKTWTYIFLWNYSKVYFRTKNRTIKISCKFKKKIPLSISMTRTLLITDRMRLKKYCELRHNIHSFICFSSQRNPATFYYIAPTLLPPTHVFTNVTWEISHERVSRAEERKNETWEWMGVQW